MGLIFSAPISRPQQLFIIFCTAARLYRNVGHVATVKGQVSIKPPPARPPRPYPQMTQWPIIWHTLQVPLCHTASVVHAVTRLHGTIRSNRWTTPSSRRPPENVVRNRQWRHPSTVSTRAKRRTCRREHVPTAADWGGVRDRGQLGDFGGGGRRVQSLNFYRRMPGDVDVLGGGGDGRARHAWWGGGEWMGRRTIRKGVSLVTELRMHLFVSLDGSCRPAKSIHMEAVPVVLGLWTSR